MSRAEAGRPVKGGEENRRAASSFATNSRGDRVLARLSQRERPPRAPPPAGGGGRPSRVGKRTGVLPLRSPQIQEAIVSWRASPNGRGRPAPSAGRVRGCALCWGRILTPTCSSCRREAQQIERGLEYGR